MTTSKILLIAFVTLILNSCGKPVENSVPDDDSSVVRTPGISINELNIQVEMNPSRDSAIEEHLIIPYDARIRIPKKIRVTRGLPLIINSKVFINAKSTRASAKDLYCLYTSIRQVTGSDRPSSDGYNHYFKGCYQDVDKDGIPDELNYKVGHQIIADRGNYIILNVQSDSSVSTLSVNSDFEVEWL